MRMTSGPLLTKRSHGWSMGIAGFAGARGALTRSGERRWPNSRRPSDLTLRSSVAAIRACRPSGFFDAGLGELFVVRVAGNILSPEIGGSLQYAGSYLKTPLFVVLGHEGCGAVGAALATKLGDEQFPSRIQLLIASIIPGLPDLDLQLSRDKLLSRAVESNVRWTVRQILDSPEGQARVAEGRMKIVGAVYEIETGLVRFLSPDERT